MKLNILNESGLPLHLGGHENMTHIDEGALELLTKKFAIKSYLDIGCGPGGMVELARSQGLDVMGVDGDFTVERPATGYIIHDYTKGPAPIEEGKIFDVGWSCEFLEHVEEQYIPNYMDSLLRCKRIVVTHAIPGQPGWHHVNCKDANYWFFKFADYGFLLDNTTTNEIRAASTMAERYIRTTGLVFFNSTLNWQVI